MKKTTIILLSLLLCLMVVLSSCSSDASIFSAGPAKGEPTVTVDDESYYAKFKDKNITLNVYNWGEYISDGSEGSIDVIEEFEKISGIDVNYTLFDTNEDMYAKLAHGTSRYDIVIPSDYMIARLIDEDMLLELNYDNIPNIKYIADEYRYVEFDPEAKYSVPYTWGMVGLVYNTKYITEEEAKSWDLLWNPKFDGKVLMFGNSRDAFGIALKRLGYSLNSENIDEIEKATESLIEQKEVNQAYAMDQTFDKMKNENAYAAPYYAGDCLTMMEDNENLAFSYPVEGVNKFIDSLCIPKSSKNKEAAEAFINFMCETEIASANYEYIWYFTPHTEVMEEYGVEEAIYPTEEDLANSETFILLGDEATSEMEYQWLKVRSTSAFDNSIYTLTLIILLVLIIFIILYVIRKRRKMTVNY